MPLAVLTVLFGIWPKPVMDVTAASVTDLVAKVERAVEANEQAKLRAAMPAELAQAGEPAAVR